jgi:hypothetical protein
MRPTVTEWVCGHLGRVMRVPWVEALAQGLDGGGAARLDVGLQVRPDWVVGSHAVCRNLTADVVQMSYTTFTAVPLTWSPGGLLSASWRRYSPVMAAARRALVAVRVVRASLRRWQPQTHWQVWMKVGGIPLAVLVIGACLRLVFRSWTFDVAGCIITAGFFALVRGVALGTRQGLALRRRRRVPQRIAGPRG